jgi:malonate-semialdehyde dehydrogenase (acetylating) / methylmalonate-semialdehyde dehydrogenase
VTTIHLPTEVRTCPNLVGGTWRSPPGARLVDVTSPYTGSLIGRVPMSTASEVAIVVDEAKRAADGWREAPVKERSQKMFRFRKLLEDNLDKLAHCVAGESGKTLAEARAGVLKGMEVVEFATSIQNLDTGGSLEVSRGVYCEYRREPLGVVAGITPFNFPAMVPMWMFPIAITVGNAFILKPSEKVPLTSVLLGELMIEAGFPPGVFSVVHGGKEAVDALVTHKDVAAVGFVGSSAVARHVYELGAMHGKRVLALGGAKNHLIVVPDADAELTAQAVVDSFTGCAGQRCMAGSVMLAVGDVAAIIEEIRRRAAAIEIGSGMGAIIDSAALGRIRSAIEVAEKDGARLLVDGRTKTPAEASYAKGTWIGPTILDGVSDAMEVSGTEVFGPVLSIMRVATLVEAVALENKNPYGNAASIFTTSGGVAQYVAEHARSGMIGVNVGVPVPREPFSFGGIQESKFGHGDITGASGIEFWSSLKKITRKWSMQHDATWMS